MEIFRERKTHKLRFANFLFNLRSPQKKLWAFPVAQQKKCYTFQWFSKWFEKLSRYCSYVFQVVFQVFFLWFRGIQGIFQHFFELELPCRVHSWSRLGGFIGSIPWGGLCSNLTTWIPRLVDLCW